MEHVTHAETLQKGNPEQTEIDECQEGENETEAMDSQVCFVSEFIFTVSQLLFFSNEHQSN